MEYRRKEQNMTNLGQVLEQMDQQPSGGRKESQVQELVQEPLSEQNLEMKKMRAPRSRKYIKAINQAVTLTETGEEMKTAVESLPTTNKLLGILSKCGLFGCIIHVIDKKGTILRHYRTPEELPPDLQEGYAVWKENQGCVSVEVYTFTICIIYDDGTVKFAERNS